AGRRSVKKQPFAVASKKSGNHERLSLDIEGDMRQKGRVKNCIHGFGIVRSAFRQAPQLCAFGKHRPRFPREFAARRSGIVTWRDSLQNTRKSACGKERK